MSLHQSAPEHSRQDWQTPEHVLELVRQMGPIVLDPCTSEDNPTGAERFWTEGGLTESWFCGGIAFVNCPYGRGIGGWVGKCIAEGAMQVEIILLVPANTDTRWYDVAALSAEARCEVRGRLTFKGASAPAKFGSALFYWGPRPHLFAHVFAALGRTYVR